MSDSMSNWDNLVQGDELGKVARSRSRRNESKTERASALPELQEEGWEFERSSKDEKKVTVRKEKPRDELFENKVWRIFYKMGFPVMNRDRHFSIQYGNDSASQQQIDVFAADSEVALVVECKSADRPGTRSDFKKTIEALNSFQNGIRGQIRNHFDGKRQVKFIFATENYVLSDEDKNRLQDAQIAYFNDDEVQYYEDLSIHLNEAAKYQLLGSLFAGKKIENMQTEVPAIRGKMGGTDYFSFSIEPTRLLKIGYVLHRNDANLNQMPTYQRVIKRSRLKQIRKFIDNGGYFPNSIIISIDARRLKFDPASKETNQSDSRSRIGILHLPAKYRSAYIIDGQHRLFGFANTKYADTETIPVVAFVDLDKHQQVQMFMDINEHQKAVPKQLRNTLNADLLWNSSDANECREAVRLTIARELGENQSSPLYKRVITGENKENNKRCITMDIINRALRDGRFLTNFKDNEPYKGKVGIFDSGSEVKIDDIHDKLYEFVEAVLKFYKDRLGKEWEQGKANSGLLAMNSGIYALIRIAADVVQFVEPNRGGSQPLFMDTEKLLFLCKPYFEDVAQFYETMPADVRADIKSQYGGNGPIKHWRYLQKAIHEKEATFPDDASYAKWWNDNSKQYNEDASRRLKLIASRIEAIVRNGLLKQNPSNDDKCLPLRIRKKYASSVLSAQEKNGIESENISTWDFLDLNDYMEIVVGEGKWKDYFSSYLSLPEVGGEKSRGDKHEKTKWMSDMQKYINGLKRPDYSISRAGYESICRVDDFLNSDKAV